MVSFEDEGESDPPVASSVSASLAQPVRTREATAIPAIVASLLRRALGTRCSESVILMEPPVLKTSTTLWMCFHTIRARIPANLVSVQWKRIAKLLSPARGYEDFYVDI